MNWVGRTYEPSRTFPRERNCELDSNMMATISILFCVADAKVASQSQDGLQHMAFLIQYLSISALVRSEPVGRAEAGTGQEG